MCAKAETCQSVVLQSCSKSLAARPCSSARCDFRHIIVLIQHRFSLVLQPDVIPDKL